MKKLICIAAMALAGCATTSTRLGMVLPQTDGSYISRSTAANTDAALQIGLKTAQATCEKIGQRHAIIKHESQYVGAYGTEESRDAVNGLRAGFAAARRTDFEPVNGKNDYRVDLHFKCLGV